MQNKCHIPHLEGMISWCRCSTVRIASLYVQLRSQFLQCSLVHWLSPSHNAPLHLLFFTLSYYLLLDNLSFFLSFPISYSFLLFSLLWLSSLSSSLMYSFLSVLIAFSSCFIIPPFFDIIEFFLSFSHFFPFHFNILYIFCTFFRSLTLHQLKKNNNTQNRLKNE